MTESKTTAEQSQGLAAVSTPLRNLLHELRQPLNVIRITAQGLRLDAAKSRLDVEALPETLREIEKAVDDLVARIDQFRETLKSKEE